MADDILKEAEILAMFERSDLEGHGGIDQRQFEVLMQKLGLNLTHQDLTAMVEAAGCIDANGVFKAEEFVHWVFNEVRRCAVELRVCYGFHFHFSELCILLCCLPRK